MSAPYAHTPRPDTGMTNARLGMGLFLAADAMFFGALFSSFAFLRTAAAYWPVGREVLPVGLNALTLAATAMGCVMALSAWAAARANLKAARRRALASAGWGALALLLALASLDQTLTHAGPPAASTFLAIYYVLYGTTISHIAIASLLSVCTAIRRFESGDVAQSRFGSAGLVWAFTLAMAVAGFAVFHVV